MIEFKNKYTSAGVLSTLTSVHCDLSNHHFFFNSSKYPSSLSCRIAKLI